MSIPRIAGYSMPEPENFPDNRVDWNPDSARAVLLIHDMQDYFLDFYDAGAAPIPALLANISALRDACDAARVPVIYTAQPSEQSAEERGLLTEFWGPGLTGHAERAAIIAALSPRSSDVALTKWRYSAFVRSDLRQRLHAAGRDQLIVCGVYAHIGCLMTCGDAFMQDVQPILVGDAVADFSAEQHAMSLQYVAQRCGVVRSAAEVCGALRGLLPHSMEALQNEVAALLDVPAADIGPEENLLYAGLDSIRLMSLVERWRRAGREIGFVDLAEKPMLTAWWQMLQKAA